jgi:hypothetical protein
MGDPTFSYGERVIAMMLSEWAEKIDDKLNLGLRDCSYNPSLVYTALRLEQDDLIDAHIDRYEGYTSTSREEKYQRVNNLMFNLGLAPKGSIPKFGGFSDDEEANDMVGVWRKAVKQCDLESIDFWYQPGNAHSLEWWDELGKITGQFEYWDYLEQPARTAQPSAESLTSETPAHV